MAPKKPTRRVNIFFSITLIALILIPNSITDEDLHDLLMVINPIIATVCLFIWGFVYSIIRGGIVKKEIAELPVLSSYAVLVEKIKEDHRDCSSYFLTFELEDGSRKLFRVQRDVYAEFSENEKGVLTYKQGVLTYMYSNNYNDYSMNKYHVNNYKNSFTDLLSFDKEKTILK